MSIIAGKTCDSKLRLIDMTSHIVDARLFICLTKVVPGSTSEHASSKLMIPGDGPMGPSHYKSGIPQICLL